MFAVRCAKQATYYNGKRHYSPAETSTEIYHSTVQTPHAIATYYLKIHELATKASFGGEWQRWEVAHPWLSCCMHTPGSRTAHPCYRTSFVNYISLQ